MVIREGEPLLSANEAYKRTYTLIVVALQSPPQCSSRDCWPNAGEIPPLQHTDGGADKLIWDKFQRVPLRIPVGVLVICIPDLRPVRVRASAV